MMAVNIANALAEEGIESHICTTRLEGNLRTKISPHVGYLFLNKKRTIDLSALKKMIKYIKEYKIAVVHAHSSSYFSAFLIKIRFPKIKVIWQDHYGSSENLNARHHFLLTLISYSFDTILSVNTKLYQWAKKQLKAKKVVYIPNFASFNTGIPKTTFLKGKENQRIVCLANLRPQKDHMNLLKAFYRVHEVYADWTLHLVGSDLNDSYAAQIKSFINSKELNNHVFLYGSCLDTQFILEQATIGVLASKSEGLPVALLEYGLVKLPVVVTDVGECGKVITTGVNGVVVTPNNENELAEAMINLIEEEETMVKFGENLYHEIQLNYSKNRYLKHLISIYKSE